MAKVIFYSVLKSLDVMNDIQALDYRNSPVVSTELVKFLSLNTSFEVVNRLESLTGELPLSHTEISQTVAGQSKSIQSVGNKHDELKKSVDGMMKRFENWENY